MRWCAGALLVAVVAACGGGDSRAVVRLTTEDTELAPGTPVAGTRVVVRDPGGVRAIVATDDEGEVPFDADGATSILVFRDTAAAPTIYIVTGIEPDMQIELGARPRPEATSVAGMQTVTYTPYPGGPWAVDNDFFPCSDGGFTGTPGVVAIETSTGCPAVERTMYLTSYEATTLAPAAFAAVDDVAAVPGERTAGAWEPGRDYTIAFTGLPAGANAAYTELAYEDAWRLVVVNTPLAGGAGTGTHRDATIPGDAAARTRISVTGAMPYYVQEPEVSPPSLAFDAAALGTPRLITNVAWDRAARAITWTETAGPAPTLVAATLHFFDQDTGLEFDWILVAPAADGRLAIPDLPDELTPYDLRTDADPVVRALWLVTIPGATYADLLEDFDFDLPFLTSEAYRPDTASLLSGGPIL